MRGFVALILWLLPAVLSAQDWEEYREFNVKSGATVLRVLSSTDIAFFEPFLTAFTTRRDDISITYAVTGTADIDRIFRENPTGYDIVISSAMDLQLKLANDGFARALPSITHPDWAHWRKSLFAFTSEPASIVINRADFAKHEIPRNRQELIQAMRARPEVFQGRIGTYDVRRSGVGYLFATQDARASETYWRLMEVMGSLDVQLYCCSGDMIDHIEDGTIAVAYNVLGSYAAARAQGNETLEIVLPADFPTTMMRTAMVSKQTAQPAAAQAFIQHLINQQTGTSDIATLLPPLNPKGANIERATIALEPALMTFLDALKRRQFLAEWENAVIQE